MDLKQSFFSKFDDPKLFDTTQFNLLKVIQNGYWTRHFDRQSLSFILPNKIYFTLIRFRSIFKFLLHRNSKIKISNRPFFFLIPNRFTKVANQYVPIYHKRFIDAVGRENSCLFLKEPPKEEIKIDVDIRYRDFWDEAQSKPYSDEENQLMKDINNILKRIKTESNFLSADCVFFKKSLQIFFLSFRYWVFILRYIQPKAGFILYHQTNEGLIAAFKRMTIPIIEIQHGVLLSNDFFYGYPKIIEKIKEKMLMPDKIWVFGEFWKKQIQKGEEYNIEQIDVIGDYILKANCDNTDKKTQRNNSKIILVVSQYSVINQLKKYILWLSDDIKEKQLNAIIVVKAHPRDNAVEYDRLIIKDNIEVIDKPIETLLLEADILISSFSAVLFDAVKYNCRSYCLFIEQYKFYIDQIVESGVAKLLQFDENPLDDDNDIKKPKPNYFFEEYNENLIQPYCNSIINTDFKQITIK